MAKSSTEDLKACSQKECDAILAEARAKAENIVADALAKKEQLLRELDDLRRSRDHFVADAKAVILRYNMLLDNAGKGNL